MKRLKYKFYFTNSGFIPMAVGRNVKRLPNEYKAALLHECFEYFKWQAETGPALKAYGLIVSLS